MSGIISSRGALRATAHPNMERAEAKLLSHNKFSKLKTFSKGALKRKQAPFFYFPHKSLDTSKARMNHAVSGQLSVVNCFPLLQLTTDHYLCLTSCSLK